MKRLFILFIIVGLIGSSCTRRLVDFTILSTKNIDMSKVASFQKGKTRTKGQDLVHIIIFFPTGIRDMKSAIDKAIEKVPGCVALLDGTVFYKWFYIPYIYGQQYYIVEGTPLIDPTIAMINSNEIPDYSIIKLDNKGNTVEMKKISKVEYLAIKDKGAKEPQIQDFKNSNSIK